MKTIKVIDLLNKIANKEDLPKKVKFHNEIFVASDEYYGEYVNQEEDSDDSRRCLFEGWVLEKILNDLVEIIEEDKEIELFELIGLNEDSNYIDIENRLFDVTQKLNELVIAVNTLKKGK